MKPGSILLVLVFVTNAFAQNLNVQNFVIDQSKPYVYLKFDHIGPRKPLQEGESNTGLWLRVVNNCRIPIVFRGFEMDPNVTGVGLFDEVVWSEPMLQIATPQNLKEIDRRENLRKLKHKPIGYSNEVSGIVRVQPGNDILFSVPVNHVDKDWYMQVKFALEIDKSSSVAVGPFTYLQFYEWDIPKEQRPAKAATQ